MILTADLACPLLLGFGGELVWRVKFYSSANSLNRWLENWHPLSDPMDSGIPCSANNSLSCVIVFAAVYWDVGIL